MFLLLANDEQRQPATHVQNSLGSTTILVDDFRGEHHLASVPHFWLDAILLQDEEIMYGRNLRWSQSSLHRWDNLILSPYLSQQSSIRGRSLCDTATIPSFRFRDQHCQV